MQGSKKTFFMDKRWAWGLWKWTSPDFFQTSPNFFPFNKISSYQGFTSKQTPMGWVQYHLRTVIRNPRRNVELIMGQIKCKQSTSFLRSMMHSLTRASRFAFFNSIQTIYRQ